MLHDLAGELLPRPRQVAQLLDRLWRNKDEGKKQGT